MKVICFGDSNTYGYDPRSRFGGRYEKEGRWVELLAEKTGWEILNEGMNGREIPGRSIPLPDDADLLIVMLGTNDLLQGREVDAVTARMERFLRGLDLPREKLLLTAPPPMERGAWVGTQALVDASVRLGRSYRALAEGLGISFADAGAWQIPLCFDGVHFTQAGHKAFAEGLYAQLQDWARI